jgi:ABC-2 type transport system permease protein
VTTFLRLALRRDRILLPVWIAAFVAVAAGSAASVVALYPTLGSIGQTGLAINATPSLLALYGPLYDAASVGALAIWKPAGSGAVLLGLLSLFTVIRHSRAEEEAARLELIGSTGVRRGAALTAALAVAAGTALVIGVLTAAALAATGLPVAGSVAFGAAWAGCGFAFAGVGAVAAQLTRSARTARGLGLAVLAVAFGLRAAGDASGPEWLTWISPLGWVQLVRAYAGERWWVLALPALLAGVLAVLAHRLDAARDLDAGVLAERPGPATGPGLAGPVALAWRLQRRGLVAWAVGFALLGALLGNLASGVGGLLDSPAMQDAVRALGGRQALSDAFLAADMAVLGLVAAAYALQAVLRLPVEERAGHAEAVLSGSVDRLRWAAGPVLVSAAGASGLMLLAGTAAGVANGVHTGDVGGEALRLAGAALAQLPAVAVVAALGIALYGLLPRAALPTSWGLLAGFVLVAELGPFLRLPQWVLDLSPFTHLPHVPGPAFSAVPLLVLGAVAAGLSALGLAGLRHRDVG